MAGQGVDGSVVIQILADDSGFNDSINNIGRNASAIGGILDHAFGNLLSDALEKAADKALEFSQNVWQAGVSFESAFAGVMKTVDETANISYDDLSEQIRDMSKTIPSTVEEISAVAEAAGQLGISAESVLDFTQVMIDMGNSTNLVAEEAASELAKFANVTKMDPSEYENLGAAIVDLGNNFATTERDIVNMSQRLAAAASSAGISEQGILAMSTALSSVGVEAEAGGTAMSTFIKKIQVAVETGSDDLNKYAEVAGMTNEEFIKLFKTDGVQAIDAFLKGLNRIDNEGGSAVVVLEEMGIKEARLSGAILGLSNAGDMLTRTIQTSTTAWEEHTALAEEAGKRYETTESQLQILKNAINDFYITLSRNIRTGFDITPVTEYINALNEALKTDGFSGLLDTGVEIIREITPRILEEIIRCISDMLPDILQAGIDIIVALVEGIGESAPTVIPTAVQTVLDLVSTLLVNTDEMVSAAASLITGLAEGLINSIPILVAKAPEIVIDLCTALINSTYHLAEAAGEFCIYLGKKMVDFDGWKQYGNDVVRNIKNAISYAINNKSYDDVLEEREREQAERVAKYSEWSAKQIEQSKEYANARLGELNEIVVKANERGYYDWDILPEWVRKGVEGSGKSIEEYITTYISNLQERITDLSIAEDEIMHDLANMGDGKQTYQGIGGTPNLFLSGLDPEAGKTPEINPTIEEAEEATTHFMEEEEAKRLHFEAEMAKERGEITEAEYYNRIETIAKSLDTESSLYQQYSKEVVKGRNKISEEAARQAEKDQQELTKAQSEIYTSAKNTVKKELQEVQRDLASLTSEFETKYNDIVNLRDKYKQRLMGESIFEVMTKTDEKTGKKITTYTIKNIDDYLKKQEEYANNIAALEERGLAKGLIDELEAMDNDQALVFMEQLGKMSDDQFNNINDSYKALDERTSQLADKRYQDDLDSLESGYIAEVKALFDGLSPDLKNAGMTSASAYIDGFSLSFNKEDKAFEQVDKWVDGLTDDINTKLSENSIELSGTIEGIVKDSGVGDELVDNIVQSINDQEDKISGALETIFRNTGLDMQIKADVENAAAVNSANGYSAAETIYVNQTAAPANTTASGRTSAPGTQKMDIMCRLTSYDGRNLAVFVNDEMEKIKIESGG